MLFLQAKTTNWYNISSLWKKQCLKAENFCRLKDAKGMKKISAVAQEVIYIFHVSPQNWDEDKFWKGKQTKNKAIIVLIFKRSSKLK